VVAGRFIGRFGSRTVLAVSMSVQGLATLPLVFLGTDRVAQGSAPDDLTGRHHRRHPNPERVAATQSVQLTGIHLALGVNVAVTLAVWLQLRPCREHRTSAGAVAASS
jgi:hypothetical protein